MVGWIITLAVIGWLVWALVRDPAPRRARAVAPRYDVVRAPATSTRDEAGARRTP